MKQRILISLLTCLINLTISITKIHCSQTRIELETEGLKKKIEGIPYSNAHLTHVWQDGTGKGYMAGYFNDPTKLYERNNGQIYIWSPHNREFYRIVDRGDGCYSLTRFTLSEQHAQRLQKKDARLILSTYSQPKPSTPAMTRENTLPSPSHQPSKTFTTQQLQQAQKMSLASLIIHVHYPTPTSAQPSLSTSSKPAPNLTLADDLRRDKAIKSLTQRQQIGFSLLPQSLRFNNARPDKINAPKDELLRERTNHS